MLLMLVFFFLFFFFNDTATTEIYTLSLHDALPIWAKVRVVPGVVPSVPKSWRVESTENVLAVPVRLTLRSEEHTSELQSRLHLVCRLLLEKKKKKQNNKTNITKKYRTNVV